MGQKSQLNALFSRYFMKNHCSFAHFWQKCPFSKKHVALMPIFCQKMSIFSQHGALISFFSNFSWKTPFGHAHDWSKKRQFCHNYTLLWARNINRLPFFFLPIFTKNHCSHAHTLSKNVHFLKSNQLSCPYLIKKMSILSKTLLSCHFFQIFS